MRDGVRSGEQTGSGTWNQIEIAAVRELNDRDVTPVERCDDVLRVALCADDHRSVDLVEWKVRVRSAQVGNPTVITSLEIQYIERPRPDIVEEAALCFGTESAEHEERRLGDDRRRDGECACMGAKQGRTWLVMCVACVERSEERACVADQHSRPVGANRRRSSSSSASETWLTGGVIGAG